MLEPVAMLSYTNKIISLQLFTCTDSERVGPDLQNSQILNFSNRFNLIFQLVIVFHSRFKSSARRITLKSDRRNRSPISFISRVNYVGLIPPTLCRESSHAVFVKRRILRNFDKSTLASFI